MQALRKSFNGTAVLKGVDLEVRHGETLVILGGSGSGKSTLLRCMVGLETPDGGTVEIQGVDVFGQVEPGPGAGLLCPRPQPALPSRLVVCRGRDGRLVAGNHRAVRARCHVLIARRRYSSFGCDRDRSQD